MGFSPPLGMGLEMGHSAAGGRRGSYRRAVMAWLVVCASLVFLMVVVGGLTRLTHSGLSMVEWRPLSILPPLTESDWHALFAQYQTSPEFLKINPGMDVDGFKSIFWLEYVHRLIGRLIGLVFAAPLIFFVSRAALSRPLIKRLALIFCLGALQGLIGWLMVASGLVDRPQVSHFRLAAHLSMALLIYAALVWTVLDLTALPSNTDRSRSAFIAAVGALGLTCLTIVWGAFVAGLHAGLIYDTFPLMNGRLFPEDGWALQPLADNFVENLSTVQFTHRLLAATTVLTLSAIWIWTRRSIFALPALWAWVQGSLGVTTLLLHVPVPVAACHQAGAVILLTLVLRSVHRLHI